MKEVVRANFDASVAAYDDFEERTGRFAGLAQSLREEMARRIDRPFERVLDAGAGTGAGVAPFADAGATVVALDLSRAMLGAAAAGEPVQGDFDRLPFVTGAFDGVAFTASLFLVPEPAVAAGEAARVCRPGGVVGAVAPLGWVADDGRDAFADLERESRSPTSADAVEAALGEHFAVESGTWTLRTSAAGIRAFHSIPAMAARLYPKLSVDERVAAARDLLAQLSGSYEERWRWVVGVSTGE